jgi:valyl-tRNA synthetase
MSHLLDQYRFSEANDLIYHLVWDDFADWYVEASKKHLNPGVLAYGLETILKLAHPFVPFVSETIWQTLKWEGESLLINSDWPKSEKADVEKAEAFEQVKAIVGEIRFIKGVMHLRTGIHLYHAGEKFLTEHADLIKSLAQLDAVKEVRDGYGLHLTTTSYNCWLDVDQETAHRFLEQLKEKATEQQKIIEQLESRLANKSYVDRAPKKLVEESKKQLEEAKEQLTKIKEEHNRFSASAK